MGFETIYESNEKIVKVIRRGEKEHHKGWRTDFEECLITHYQDDTPRVQHKNTIEMNYSGHSSSACSVKIIALGLDWLLKTVKEQYSDTLGSDKASLFDCSLRIRTEPLRHLPHSNILPDYEKLKDDEMDLRVDPTKGTSNISPSKYLENLISERNAYYSEVNIKLKEYERQLLKKNHDSLGFIDGYLYPWHPKDDFHFLFAKFYDENYYLLPD